MHQSAMTDIAKKPNAVVATFDADSPVKKVDIKYVLGSGKAYQQYVDKNLKVLPGKWVVGDKKWVKTESVDGGTQCVGCHSTNFNPTAKTWTELGVGCESCHGPAGDHTESMEAKDIVNPKNLDAKRLNMVCGQCHSQGTDISGRYAFSTSFMPGDDLDKSFKLKPPVEGQANSQYNSFITSKHAQGGMKCTSCHDTHGDKAKDKHQLKMTENALCLGCHSQQLGSTKAIEPLNAHAPDSKADTTCADCHILAGSHEFKKASK
jgi:predicted CXXCH cytochrome family protein